MRANCKCALSSHVLNFVRQYGYTDAPNPCAGIKRHKETGRDRCVEHEEFLAVWNKAHYTVQNAMDLAYLTGQRSADLLKFNRSDIRGGGLYLVQNKTGKSLSWVNFKSS